MTDLKTCAGCGGSLPRSQYHKRKKSPDGLMTRCKACQNEYGRRHHFLKKYGLSLDEREAIFASQEYRCAVCGRRTALVIDHDHITMKVRGGLCDRCNLAIGTFEDDADRMRKAADYLDATR